MWRLRWLQALPWVPPLLEDGHTDESATVRTAAAICSALQLVATADPAACAALLQDGAWQAARRRVLQLPPDPHVEAAGSGWLAEFRRLEAALEAASRGGGGGRGRSAKGSGGRAGGGGRPADAAAVAAAERAMRELLVRFSISQIVFQFVWLSIWCSCTSSFHLSFPSSLVWLSAVRLQAQHIMKQCCTCAKCWANDCILHRWLRG